MRRTFWCYQKQVHNVLCQTLEKITCNNSSDPDVFSMVYLTAIFMTLQSVRFMYNKMMCKFVYISISFLLQESVRQLTNGSIFGHIEAPPVDPGPSLEALQAIIDTKVRQYIACLQEITQGE